MPDLDLRFRSTPGEPMLRWLMAAPPLMVTIMMCVIAIAARTGVQMFAEAAPLNPSEAAVRRDLPALVSFRQGGDLRRRYPLRPDFAEFSVSAATPLEASILSQSGAIVGFVMRAAPPLTMAERDAAVCLGLDVGADERAMQILLGDGPQPACTRNAALTTLQRGR